MRLFFYSFIIVCAFLATAQSEIREIDEYMIKARQDWNVPGMSVAIIKDGEIVLSRGYGFKESGKPERVDENTLFAIASNTKAFISASLSLLVQQGQLKWKDKVIDYLPDFELYDHYATSQATIEDLLCHRVGLGTYSGDLMWYKSELPASEVVKRLKYVPQAFGFRDGYGYTNLMFIAAGEVIQKVSGQPWNVFVDSVFFKPLQMLNTVTSTEELKNLPTVASPHKPYAGGNQVIEWVNWDNMGAAGGIISSAADMAKWINLQLNNGIVEGDTLIAKEQQRKMWTIHNSRTLTNTDRNLIPGRTYKGYGLGWSIDSYRNKQVISHGGGYDGMYSKVMMIPEEKLGIVILTNSMKSIADPLCYFIMDKYLGAENRDWSAEMLSYQGSANPSRIEILRNTRVKRTKPTLDLKHYTGTFFSGMHGKVNILQHQDQLRLEFENAPKLNATLSHWHYDTWEINWDEDHAWFGFGVLQFLIDPDMSVKGLHFDVPNHDIFFDEVDLKRVD